MVTGKLMFGFILGNIASTLANAEAVRVLYDAKLTAIRVRCIFVCLFGFNVTFKHLRSYHDVLPHRNATLQTQDVTPHPVTVYRHGVDLSLCYPLMWNVTLDTQLPILMSWLRPDGGYQSEAR